MCQCKRSSVWSIKKGFIAKMYIAYKEANEAEYWLELLHESELLEDNLFDSLYNDNHELIKILASITKSVRQ